MANYGLNFLSWEAFGHFFEKSSTPKLPKTGKNTSTVCILGEIYFQFLSCFSHLLPQKALVPAEIKKTEFIKILSQQLQASNLLDNRTSVLLS